MDTLRILNKAADLFEDPYGSEKLKKKVISLLGNEDFLKAIYDPDLSDCSKEEANAAITRVYDLASKKAGIQLITEALSDYGHYNLGRASACFLATLVNLGMANIDAKATDLGRAKDHDEVGVRSYDRSMSKLENYQDDLYQLLKIAKKIVRGPAKKLSEITGLPKSLCASTLFSVPGVEYVSQYKLGFYLKTVLGNLYGYVNMAPEEFDDFDEISWKNYFRATFGKDRLPDIASLVLLEGVERIQNYENYRDVRACWDSITRFALRTLNGAPESIRDQMIELYLKRLNKMLYNHGVDLRVDLRMIDDLSFDKLAQTVKKYKSKIDSVMDSFKTLANAKAETRPSN